MQRERFALTCTSTSTGLFDSPANKAKNNVAIPEVLLDIEYMALVRAGKTVCICSY